MRQVLVGKKFDLKILDESNLLNPKNEDTKKRRQGVSVGHELHFDASISAKRGDDRVRSRLVWAFIGLGIVFLLGAAAIGTYSGDFGPLASVWGVIGPIYGGLAGYYFPQRKG